MAIDYPQFELPRGLSGGADLWDDDGAAGQILRADYFTQAPTPKTLATSLGAAVALARNATASLGSVVRADRTVGAAVDASVAVPLNARVTWAEMEIPAASGAVAKTAIASLSAAVRAALGATASLGAAVRRPLSVSGSVTTAVRSASQAQASTGAAVRAAQQKTAGVSASVRAPVAQSASLGAAVLQARTATAGLSTALAVERQAHADLSAALQATVEVSAGLDAYIETAVFISALDLQRLTEIWARMELDPARPLSTSVSELTVGTITQAIGTSGAMRTGALLPAGSDPATMISEIWQRLGLDPDHPLQQTETTLTAGSISCTIAEAGGVVTVTRQ